MWIREPQMAKAKYINEIEREAIRIGLSIKLNAPAIAHYLGRNKQTVYNEIEKLEKDGTIGNMPMPFLVEAIGRDMQRSEAERQAGMRR